MPEVISSIKNETIQLVKSVQKKKGRKEHGLFLAEGMRLLGEILQSERLEPAVLLYDPAFQEHALVRLALQKNLRCRAVEPEILRRACDSENPQGILALVKIPKNESVENVDSPALALDGVADPGNMGTILRTAWAFGVRTVLLSDDCVDVYSPKVVRSGMGAHAYLKFIQANLAQVLQEMKQHKGYEIIAGDLQGDIGKRENGKQRICFIVGNEAFGIRDIVKATATQKYRIPMEGGAESLNAAVAAGILMDRFLHP